VAVAPQLARRLLVAPGAASQDADVRPGARQGIGDSQADAAVAAGDEGDVTVQIEVRFHAPTFVGRNQGRSIGGPDRLEPSPTPARRRARPRPALR
jgi:hypothetical protein